MNLHRQSGVEEVLNGSISSLHLAVFTVGDFRLLQQPCPGDSNTFAESHAGAFASCKHGVHFATRH